MLGEICLWYKYPTNSLLGEIRSWSPLQALRHHSRQTVRQTEPQRHLSTWQLQTITVTPELMNEILLS